MPYGHPYWFLKCGWYLVPVTRYPLLGMAELSHVIFLPNGDIVVGTWD